MHVYTHVHTHSDFICRKQMEVVRETEEGRRIQPPTGRRRAAAQAGKTPSENPISQAGVSELQASPGCLELRQRGQDTKERGQTYQGDKQCIFRRK